MPKISRIDLLISNVSDFVGSLQNSMIDGISLTFRLLMFSSIIAIHCKVGEIILSWHILSKYFSNEYVQSVAGSSLFLPEFTAVVLRPCASTPWHFIKWVFGLYETKISVQQ